MGERLIRAIRRSPLFVYYNLHRGCMSPLPFLDEQTLFNGWGTVITSCNYLNGETLFNGGGTWGIPPLTVITLQQGVD